MGIPGIAIGGAAALALACGGAIVWVGIRPAVEEVVHEGVLLSRPALDGLVVSVKDENFSCPNAIHGELMDSSDIGRVYRVSCAASGRGQPPTQFRITVRPFSDPSVEPW
jgi:hypothetical protein